MMPQDYLKKVQAVTLRKQGGNYQSPIFTTTPSAASPIQPMNPAQPIFTTVPKVQGASPTNQPPSPYINPKTGQQYTPQEYANNMALRIPPPQKGTGDVPQYAGDQFTKPNQTAEQQQMVAATLNNARNDIATGTTDPYGATTGIAYSPAERAAIEKAYAGVYDPAINSALAKLDVKQKEDAALLKAQQDRAAKIFDTNESIRQWKATTGTGPTYSGGTGGNSGKQFTTSQLNNGAMNAGMPIETFAALDDDLKNFYINTPTELNPNTNKMQPMYETFANLIKGVTSGKLDAQTASDEIMNSPLPDTVKHYFIDQLPLTQPQKEGYFTKIWKAVTGQ